MAHRHRSVYHRATCIGMHCRFCKTGFSGTGALHTHVRPDACLSVIDQPLSVFRSGLSCVSRSGPSGVTDPGQDLSPQTMLSVPRTTTAAPFLGMEGVRGSIPLRFRPFELCTRILSSMYVSGRRVARSRRPVPRDPCSLLGTRWLATGVEDAWVQGRVKADRYSGRRASSSVA